MFFLYLTRNENSDLLDFAFDTYGQVPKKMIGDYSLTEFVAKDMRNFAHTTHLIVDRPAIKEDDEGFLEAVKSFQLMYNARIVVMLEGAEPGDELPMELVEMGVTDIVAGTVIEEVKADILDALSDTGMPPEKYERFRKGGLPSLEGPSRLHFTCRDIRIAIAGSQHRVGVTSTALNLASFLAGAGAKVCCGEAESSFLPVLKEAYEVTEKVCGFRFAGIDFGADPDVEYHFHITDCGVDTDAQAFRTADLRILCGCTSFHELPRLAETMGRCTDLDYTVLCHFSPMQDRMDIAEELERQGKRCLFMEYAPALFDGRGNAGVYGELVKEYAVRELVGERKAG